ncbi:ABC transporter substrate-binding protein [Scleromatobacter humisilvae]|uniref:ABC transporter substrate-binding protein n=1 Tax=Scleromatobacter humisilvae TaxID=2897159 RepID=A0A9X1YHB8_9BURK|nr:ABC transporter substrate-binding protein [Scleromatobacter humisilvae]MCK9686484.1 ABC transporter substrate-binding protein [Scleromatobacter humisilvae]
MGGVFGRWGGAAWLAACALLASLAGCDNSPWESGAASQNTLFTAMQENSPRHMDSVASYWSNDLTFTMQIYEPPYGYHYLKRPYELVGKSAEAVAQPRFLDKDGHELPQDAPIEQIAESVYDVHIKHGILYQPHPAFARDAAGNFLYHHLKPGELAGRSSPWEFEKTGTRELVADDFVYAIKRQATTRITAPVYSIFSEHVIGLADYGQLIKLEDAKLRAGSDPASLDRPFLDFRKYPLAGAFALDKYTFRVRIKGRYPQWNYWMAMTFMAPVPWEAEEFYAQPGMAVANLTYDIWPVGTGPFMLSEYHKDRLQVMLRNPNYRGEPYPCEGAPGDKEAGLLDDCGKKTPFVDKIVVVAEREQVPQRAKFRQGYYDLEVFDRTDKGMEYIVEKENSDEVRKDYDAKGFRLDRFDDVWSYVIAFNMLDPVIGDGATPQEAERHRKLREAISIAIDWEEFAKVFPYRAGPAAMGPIPAGIFGSRQQTAAGVNPVTHRLVGGVPVRRSIEDARALMVEAGYPGGRDAATGRPLVLNYDFYALPTPERKIEIDWVVRQFAKLDIQLEVRATDNNQFQDKIRKGKHQVFWTGWNADYPDAENFLVLFYGPNSKSLSDGENQSNYRNPRYDALFEEMRSLPDGPRKQALIDQMVDMLRQDAPWSWGYFPYSSDAVQHWVYNSKAALLIRDHGRYLRIDVDERRRAQAEWNRPVWWPMVVLTLAFAGLLLLAVQSFRRRERLNARGELLPA